MFGKNITSQITAHAKISDHPDTAVEVRQQIWWQLRGRRGSTRRAGAAPGALARWSTSTTSSRSGWRYASALSFCLWKQTMKSNYLFPVRCPSEHAILIQKGFKCTKNPSLKDLWMPRKRAKNGLKIHWISKKLLRLYVNTLRLKNFVYFQVFCKILARIFFWFFEHFDSFLGKKWIQQPLEQFFYNLGMSKKNFSSKFKLWAKWLERPLVYKQSLKKIHLRPTQECL